MYWIGSKSGIAEKIVGIIEKEAGISPRSRGKFLDACAGMGHVSEYAKRLGYLVTAVDPMYCCAEVCRSKLGKNVISCVTPWYDADSIVDFYRQNRMKNYRPVQDLYGGRYFTHENAMRIDAFRDEIERCYTGEARSRYIHTLLEESCRVSNTAGVFAAFLKKFKATSIYPINMLSIVLVSGGHQGDVRHGTILGEASYLSNFRYQVVYFDPPYNHRQYGANYHVLETIARGDHPEVKGISRMRSWEPSDFCSKQRALPYFEKCMDFSSSVTDCVAVSYNDEGILSMRQIRDSVRKHFPEVKIFRFEHKRYAASTNQKATVYEHVVVGKKSR